MVAAKVPPLTLLFVKMAAKVPPLIVSSQNLLFVVFCDSKGIDA